MRELIRTVRFTPYRKGFGPTYRLRLYDTGRTQGNKSVLGYTLSERSIDGHTSTLFEGEDFCCSPLHAIDSDSCVAALMGFLTLRKGDTDADYFDNYTAAQLDFAETHAETLSMTVMDRFERRDNQ